MSMLAYSAVLCWHHLSRALRLEPPFLTRPANGSLRSEGIKSEADRTPLPMRLRDGVAVEEDEPACCTPGGGGDVVDILLLV